MITQREFDEVKAMNCLWFALECIRGVDLDCRHPLFERIEDTRAAVERLYADQRQRINAIGNWHGGGADGSR